MAEFDSQSDYKPGDPEADFKNGFLFPVRNIVKMLKQTLHLSPPAPQQGLLLIAGATKAAKSVVARGLIFEYLKELALAVDEKYLQCQGTCKSNQPSLGQSGCSQCDKAGHKVRQELRHPHLVTFEDPIEKWLWKQEGEPAPVANCLLDYTPRERKVDAGSLVEALHDALRQTPSVVYIGEIREESDWAHVIEFAGTGHLVVATAHGGSLTETFVKICRALKSDTPAQRNYIATRLLGVVHLSAMKDLPREGLSKDLEKNPRQALIGSIWRGTPAGIHALTSDGFTSLAPANLKNLDPPESEYCFGHSWWGEAQLHELDRLKYWRGRGIKHKRFRAALKKMLLAQDIREV